MNKVAEEQLQMIQDCLCERRQRHLAEWDVQFVTDMAGRITLDMGLSTKQIDMLEKIWEKATKNG